MASRRMAVQWLSACVVILALIRLPGDRTRVGPEPRTRFETRAPPHAALLRTPAAVERVLEEGFYATAEAAARDLLERTEDTHGPFSRQTAEALDLVVRCLPFGPTARDAESSQLAERAVDLKRRLYGHDDPRVAVSLAYQAVLCEVLGSTVEAESLHTHALALIEDALGPEHPLHVVIIREFAPLLNQLGQYQRTLQLTERALQILAAAPDSIHKAHVLNAQSWSYYQLGDYARAVASIDQAIAIREALFGVDHNRVQGIVNNRAIYLHEMGNYPAALEAYQRVLESLRRTLDDPRDLRIGAAQLNVGLLEIEMGDFESARQDLHAALEFATKRDIQNHELAADCLLGLGRTYYEMGDDDDSEAYFKQALDVCQTALPTGHPLITAVLRQLAELYYECGQLDLAHNLCARAESTLVATVGREHPYRADVETIWGRILAATDETDAAIEKSLHAEKISAAHLSLMARGFAEREALLYGRRRPHALDVPLRLVAQGAKPSTVGRVWEAVVRSRALVLQEMQMRSRRAALAQDETTTRLVAELRQASTRVANLTVRGPGSDRQHHGAVLAAAQHDREAAERRLASHSATFRHDLQLERAGLEEVAASLPSGSALVAFVVYDRNERRRRAGAAAEARHEASFVAFVLAPDRDPQVVKIGLQREIEARVAAWNREAAYGVLLRSRTPAQAEAAYFAAGEALRKLVWDPLETLLGDARAVLVVPEGAMHLVSFAALPTAEGEYLVEAGWRFLYLTAEHDVIAHKGSDTHNVGLLAIGDVDFEATPPREVLAQRSPTDRTDKPIQLASRGENPAGPAIGTLRAALPCDGLEGVEATELPGTAVEVRQVADLWKRSNAASSRAEPLTILTRAEATENAFERLASGHRVLHIATHAFFLAADCVVGGQPTMKTRQLRPNVLSVETGSEPILEKPPSLAGFFLAGAAHRNDVALDQNDGVLTAQEIAMLDLQGVEWAVLSGCDTGVGDVQVGEGVHGLRRAFHIAGVGSVIMSLWAVSDDAAQEWMTSLYEARFVDGLDTIDAVHEATLQRLEMARTRGRGTHPFFWGAFVVAGRAGGSRWNSVDLREEKP